MEKASQFLHSVVSTLAEDKSSIAIDTSVDDRGVLLTLHIAQPDMGRIIGKKGSMAQAIRTILRAIGAQEGLNVSMRVIDPRETAPAPETSAS